MTRTSTVIRPLQLHDLSIVAAIAKKSMDYPWGENVFRDCLKADYHIWVLELEKSATLIGFLIVLDQMNECQLLNIAVLPEYQRQGYGKQLLSYAIAHAESKNFQRIILEVRASNKAAILVYHATGFIDVGIRKNYYPAQHGREDAILMILSCHVTE